MASEINLLTPNPSVPNHKLPSLSIKEERMRLQGKPFFTKKFWCDMPLYFITPSLVVNQNALFLSRVILVTATFSNDKPEIVTALNFLLASTRYKPATVPIY